MPPRSAAICGDVTVADTSNVASCITHLIAAVASTFPNLTPAEFSIALQTATAQAERQAARRH